MKNPPDHIDDAKVLKWAWSGQEPFGFISSEDGREMIAVYGIAICQYEDEGIVYRFSCDKNWVTVQDAPYNNIQQAIERLPDQYKNVRAEWHIIHPTS